MCLFMLSQVSVFAVLHTTQMHIRAMKLVPLPRYFHQQSSHSSLASSAPAPAAAALSAAETSAAPDLLVLVPVF